MEGWGGDGERAPMPDYDDEISPETIDAIRRLVRLRGREIDLKLCEPRVRGRHHEKDQDDEQDVDQRNEVDLGIVTGAGGTEVHGARCFNCARRARNRRA